MQSSPMQQVPRCAIVVGICLAGCSDPVAAQLSRKAAPAEAAASAITAYDRDDNGSISPEELKESPALAAGAERIDANRDGFLTRDELQQRFEAIEAGSDLIAMSLRVTVKRQPIVGATVTLEPESFMGDGLQSYSGVTADGGGCQLEGTEVKSPGLPVGYYRARIVHQSLRIGKVLGSEVGDTTGNRMELAL